MPRKQRKTVRHKRAVSLGAERAKIQVYVTAEEKVQVERAAELSRMGVSFFASRLILPEARRVLREHASEEINDELDFRPVEIRGEPLSTTVLRERR